MEPIQHEFFTAEQAVNAGLNDALERGEAKIKGFYEYSGNGDVEFHQHPFAFRDSFEILHVGKFVDNDELLKFMKLSRTGEI